MNNSKYKWRYQFIYQFEVEIETYHLKAVREAVEVMQRGLAGMVSVMRIGKEELLFLFQMTQPIQMHKTLKNLQKLLRKHGLTQMVLEAERWTLVSQPVVAQEEPRLCKLLRSINDTSYYDLNSWYGPDPGMLSDFLLERRLGCIETSERFILVDEEALLQKINLNCEVCTKKFEYGCCCGSPCNYSKRNLKHFEREKEDIISALKQIEPEFYKQILEEERCNGALLSKSSEVPQLVSADGAVGECNGRCVLLIREEGMAKCLTHKYALEHGLSIYEMSPLSCLLFPMEIIELVTDKGKRILLFTSVVDDELARKFGRWGSYKRLEVELNCVQISLHNNEFLLKDYQPVYTVNKGLITHEFGEQVYQGVQLLLGN